MEGLFERAACALRVTVRPEVERQAVATDSTMQRHGKQRQERQQLSLRSNRIEDCPIALEGGAAQSTQAEPGSARFSGKS